MDPNTKERISQIIGSEPVVLFMKGNPTFPQCGFSNQVVQILKAYGVPFGHFDVLSDMDIRQGIKDFSDWPTIPQLYIKGEFIGGCDIVRESWQSGELTDMLKGAFPDQEISPPQPPSEPKDITPQQAKAMQDKGGEIKLLDVRTDEERAIVSLDGYVQLNQEKAQEVLETVDKNTPLVFICHYGGRSKQAAEFFAQQGFQKTYNVVGGIDEWANSVDTSLARY